MPSPGRVQEQETVAPPPERTSGSGGDSSPTLDEPAAAPRRELILIGRIVRAVGLNGWVKVSLMTDFPERLAVGRKIRIRRPGGDVESRRVAGVKPTISEDFFDLLLEGVGSRDEAQALRGCELVIPAGDRRVPQQDCFYPDELPGMTVLDRNGLSVGEVVSLEAGGPAPYLTVRSLQAVEVLIPFRKVFIGDINRTSRTVRLSGLLEDHIPV